MFDETPSHAPTILRVDSSARRDGSVSRALSDTLVDRLVAAHPGASVRTHDLLDGAPLLTPDWVSGTFTPKAERTPAQKAALAHSDHLVADLKAADVLVIGAPIYNFSVPAALKAWIDQIARAGETFRYTDSGPQGLLSGKTAYIVVASGGVSLGSPVDFATDYLRHVLGFVGITDVHFIDATGGAMDADGAYARAEAQIGAAQPAAA